jgi:integrase
MRGSTRRRGTTWTAYWDLPADPKTGNRRQASKGGFARQKDAERHLANVITQVGEGTYVEPSKQPLARFMLDEWLPGIGATLRPLSRHRYERIVSTYVASREVGAVPLRSLTGAHLNKLYAELEAEGLSIATRRLTHAVLRRSLNDAVRWGKLARNPATAADPPSLPRTRVKSWTARELRRFLDHVADDRLFALWRLAATTGMRRGELLATSWQCLDLEGAQLRIEQQLIPSPAKCPHCDRTHSCSFGPPKSQRSERTIALDRETVDALRHHRATQVLERDLAGPAYVDHDLVFADELGQPIHPQRISEWFLNRRAAAKLTLGSVHVLRHTHATIALTAGIPLHVVAARLGDDPKTVLGTYAHLLPHSDAEAAAVVAAAIVDKPLTADTPEPLEAP